MPDAAGGIIPPDAMLVLSNSSGAGITVTAQTPSGAVGLPTGLDLTDRTHVVAAGGVSVIGPFPATYYARTSAPDAGQVYVDFSAVANLVVTAIRVPPKWPA